MIEKKAKLTKLVGLKFSEFEELIKNGVIQAQPARLIPTYKTGDELHLASVLLSSMKMVREYREKIFQEIKFKKSGSHYFFTEVAFTEKELSSCRFDGLILKVISGEIRDAIFLEFKGKNAKIDPDQIERYIPFIKNNFKNANKLVSVSTEFVADASHVPYTLNGKLTRNFSVHHLSWSQLKMIAHLLLFDNDENIEDSDQVALMREVLEYLEHDSIGLQGYKAMKAGWKEVSASIKNGAIIKDDKILEEAVQSWIEEQTDMAHILSKELGIMVRTCASKNSGNFSSRLKSEISELKKTSTLDFDLEIKGAYSNIRVTADFVSESVSMSVNLSPPKDRKNKGRLTWAYKQLEKAHKKEQETFDSIKSNIYVDVNIKYSRTPVRVQLKNYDALYEELDMSSDNIMSFHILYINQLRGKFSSGRGFVNTVESMMFQFYVGIVQNVRSWVAPLPRIKVGDE